MMEGVQTVDEKKLTLLDLVPVTAPSILSPEMMADMSKYLMDTTQVVHRQIREGSVTIECEYDEVYSAPLRWSPWRSPRPRARNCRASLSTALETPAPGQSGKS